MYGFILIILSISYFIIAQNQDPHLFIDTIFLKLSFSFMIELEKKDVNKHKIPETCGFFIFFKEEKVLHFSKSINLNATIRTLLTKNSDNENILKLNSHTKTISYQTTENIFEALLVEKKFSLHNTAEFKFDNSANYAYLAVDFTPPYFRLKEDTQGNSFYVGPFINRFLVLDALESFHQFFQYPACENEKYPCSKLRDASCKGWCQKENLEIYDLIIKSYLQINQKNLINLELKQNEMMENLDFIEAENIKRYSNDISKFYELIIFFLVTKELKINLKTCKINNGLIKQIDGNNFSLPEIKYRNNEMMAFNKNEFAERWIIFKQLKNEKTINKIYKKNLLKMKSYFRKLNEV